jgi:hypothetical protein
VLTSDDTAKPLRDWLGASDQVSAKWIVNRPFIVHGVPLPLPLFLGTDIENDQASPVKIHVDIKGFWPVSAKCDSHSVSRIETWALSFDA